MALLCACGGSDSAGGTLTVCADGNGMNESFLGPILAEFERYNPDWVYAANADSPLQNGTEVKVLP